MSTINDKATFVAQQVSGGPSAPGPLLQQIIAIITQLLTAMGLCKAPAARVHRIANNPNALQRLSLLRTVKQNVQNPALVDPVISGILTMGASLSLEEATAMYQEATTP